MWSWVQLNFVELVATAWAIRELWIAKGNVKKKAIETAQLVYEAKVRHDFDAAIEDVKVAGEAVPDKISEWRRKLAEADRQLRGE